MMRSMYAGVSGLKAHQTKMDVIGNNISNVNTTGFKGSRVSFKSMLSQTIKGASAPQAGRGGTNPQQIGLGTAVGSIDTNIEQGNLQSTGKNTDIALQGNGYFIANDGSKNVYTRAGNLTFDEEGFLVHSTNGNRMQGWTAENYDIENPENINTSETEDIKLEQSMEPKKTSFIDYAGNFDSSVANELELASKTFKIGDGSGNTDSVTMELSKTDDFNEWSFDLTADNSNTEFTNATPASIIGGVSADASQSLTSDVDMTINVNGTDYTGTLNSGTFDGSTPEVSDIVSAIEGATDSGGDPLSDVANISESDGNITIDSNFSSGSSSVSVSYSGGTVSEAEALTGISGGTSDTDKINTLSGTMTLDKDGSITNMESENGNDLLANPIEIGDIAGSGGTTTINVDADISSNPLLTGSNIGETISADYNQKAQQDFTTDIFDSQGNKHTVSFKAEKTGSNNWIIEEDTVNVTNADSPSGSGDWFDGSNFNLNFNEDGKLIGNGEIDLSFDSPDTGTQTVNLDFSSLSQYAGDMTAEYSNYDGYSAGNLQSFSIDNTGNITGTFDNGYNKKMAMIGVAQCDNPAGLNKIGDTFFEESNNSGEMSKGFANSEGRGEISAGNLEMSNVDLSKQFTEMITTQRGFQGNSKTITTTDEMLQEIVNLKR